MRTSDLVALAVALLVPAVCATGCIDGSTCLRNSDCPAADICSIGACILAPIDNGEGGTDEAGAEAGPLPDAGTPAGRDSGVDATLSDAGGDADAATGTGDSGDSGATADDATAFDASTDDASDAAPE